MEVKRKVSYHVTDADAIQKMRHTGESLKKCRDEKNEMCSCCQSVFIDFCC